MTVPSEEMVVLVDQNDTAIGVAEKMSVHHGQGVLHRAVSVLVYRRLNDKIEVLLQKRADQKPLWPGHWTNTICTHPRVDELPLDCAVRRLQEEMGITVRPQDVIKIDDFYYQSAYTDELSEHEYDHVYLCSYNGAITPSANEVAEWRWVFWDDVMSEVHAHPERFTGWFRLMVHRDKVQNSLQAV